MRTAERHDVYVAATDFTTVPFGLDHLSKISFSFRVDGTPGGVRIQGTLYPEVTASDPFTDNVTLTPNPDAVWTPLDAFSIDAGSGDNYIAESYYEPTINTSGCRGYRLTWDPTGVPNGIITIDWFGKGPQS